MKDRLVVWALGSIVLGVGVIAYAVYLTLGW